MIIIKVGFIGAGKVGFSIGRYLKEKDINVTGYFSRREDSSLEASLFTKTKQKVYERHLLNFCFSDAKIIITHCMPFYSTK